MGIKGKVLSKKHVTVPPRTVHRGAKGAGSTIKVGGKVRVRTISTKGRDISVREKIPLSGARLFRASDPTASVSRTNKNQVERAETPPSMVETVEDYLQERHARLRMLEQYQGIVEHVHDDTVIVVYEAGEDDIIEHTYDRRQFAEGCVPKKGDRLTLHVFLTDSEPASQEQVSSRTSISPYARAKISGPIEF